MNKCVNQVSFHFTWAEVAQLLIHHQHLTFRVHVTYEILDTEKLFESLLREFIHKMELDLLPLTVSTQGVSET